MNLRSDADSPDSAELALNEAKDALNKLAVTRPEIIVPFARLVSAVADEATRTTRFATSLRAALLPDISQPLKRRTGRRAAGVLDPFEVYAAEGEDNLRSRLDSLDLEQLRDIVAEHGMDNDRLAMKWKDKARVIERISERVVARASKGSAFRDHNE